MNWMVKNYKNTTLPSFSGCKEKSQNIQEISYYFQKAWESIVLLTKQVYRKTL